ncbi:Hsp20/alpha crystallin family protein [Caldibacillus lycopersici]|uniref:Hsp20/alpha crystallin family protein n=1 Tax=Perspicuibacillus lycopersici TaxID=1325689 RepID=A0AAE3IS46_9BACI|nr:Hsp20/alpha crystallin family protein [Perspicuibacillus lycopersici]MCU9613610.1 Hsp20/alpha crystallin family protein [Perspicuibacillus lycopersici]
MFPWNFFGFNKNGNDPFKPLTDGQLQKMMDQLSNMFPDYLKTFAQQANNPKENTQQRNSDLEINEKVFETHDYVYIRIPIVDESVLKAVKIYYSLNKCIIDGFKGKDTPYSIILPATVKKKGAKAIYRDNVLEIKIPKSLDWQMSEINVDNMEQPE